MLDEIKMLKRLEGKDPTRSCIKPNDGQSHDERFDEGIRVFW